MTAAARVVVACLLLAAAPAAALEPAIGRVERADGGGCTGTLVAPDRVLTAAHCVLDHETGKPLPPAKLRFRAGAAGARERAAAPVAGVSVAGAFAYRTEPSRLGHLRCDLARLRLTRGLDVTPLALRADPDPEASFDAVGYPGYAPGYQRKQYGCTRSGRAAPEGIWPTTCFAVPGVSGAPLLTPTRPPRVLGVLVARWERISVAVPLAAAPGCGIRIAE
jgi:V8-like Glu-specific endopeptidase